MYDLEFYLTSAGRCPYEEYVEGLFHSGQKKAAARIEVIVEMLAEHGSQRLVGMQKAEKMNDVWQLRKERHRIFYFWDTGGRKYVIMHGFLKATKKTPPAELAHAERFMNDYLNRSGQGGSNG